MHADLGRHATDDLGMTITELMVVLVLMGVILSAAYMVLNAVSKISDYSTASMLAQDENRQTLDRLGLDVRQAQGLADSNQMLHVFAIASPREAMFYSQPDTDTSAERIHYAVVGNDLVRGVSQPTTGTLQAYPGSWGVTTSQTILPDLSASFSGPIFTYIGGSGVASPSITSITAVQLHVISALRSGAMTATVDSSSMTTIRSVVGSLK